MSTRDPLPTDPFAPSDDPLASTPGRTDVPLTEPLDPVRDPYIDPMAERDRHGDSDSQSGPDSSGMKDKVQETAGQAQAKVGEVAGKAQEKADEVAGKAQEAASEVGEKVHATSDKGINSAASGLEQAAGMLRQQGEGREGTIGTAATKTADTLETASAYLHEKDTDQLVADLEALVRRKPVESVLVAAGIGFVLSKIVR